MKVTVVALTQPCVEGIKDAQELVSYCARVSNPNNQLNTKTAAGLLKYCIKHKHFSVFEMANMVVEIETTRDISRQILRHRSFSFQEFSQRYAEIDPEIIYRETRMQDLHNRQSSVEVGEDSSTNISFKLAQLEVWNTALNKYNEALLHGVAKEQARALLPEGLVGTRMYMNGTIRSWITYCMVRCGVETQKEHRLIAKEICKKLIENFPFLAEILTVCLEDNYSAEQ